MASRVPHHSCQGPAHPPALPSSHEPCHPPILLTHTSGPATNQPPRVPQKPSQICRMAFKSAVSQSVPGSSRATPPCSLNTCSLFCLERSSEWLPPLSPPPPRCQPLRRVLPISVPLCSLICFKTSSCLLTSYSQSPPAGASVVPATALRGGPVRAGSQHSESKGDVEEAQSLGGGPEKQLTAL